MKTIKGDLLKLADEDHFDAIVHGCNCFHLMGAGIARQIKSRWPEAFLADLQQTDYADKFKLGQYSSIQTKTKSGKEITIINAYTQYSPGPNVDYKAIENVFEKIANDFRGKTIAYPAIGAGIGGGDWNKIKSIIDEKLDSLSHIYVEYSA